MKRYFLFLFLVLRHQLSSSCTWFGLQFVFAKAPKGSAMAISGPRILPRRGLHWLWGHKGNIVTGRGGASRGQPSI